MNRIARNALFVLWFLAAGFIQAVTECVFLAMPASYGAYIALTQWPGVVGGMFVGLCLSAAISLFQQDGKMCAGYATGLAYITGGVLFDIFDFVRTGRQTRFVDPRALFAEYPVLRQGARIGVLIGLAAAYTSVATIDDGDWDQWCRFHRSVPLYATSFAAILVGLVAVAGNKYFYK